VLWYCRKRALGLSVCVWSSTCFPCGIYPEGCAPPTPPWLVLDPFQSFS
jgi:hypothetical protein